MIYIVLYAHLMNQIKIDCGLEPLVNEGRENEYSKQSCQWFLLLYNGIQHRDVKWTVVRNMINTQRARSFEFHSAPTKLRLSVTGSLNLPGSFHSLSSTVKPGRTKTTILVVHLVSIIIHHLAVKVPDNSHDGTNLYQIVGLARLSVWSFCLDPNILNSNQSCPVEQ